MSSPQSDEGQHEQNGDLEHKISAEDAQRRRSRWAAAVESFSPIWYALVMNTGILSIIMQKLPYQFGGLGVLSTILFVFTIVQFILYTIVHLARLIIFPRSVYIQTSTNGEEACLWGCANIGLLTITAQLALTASTSKWGYHDFSMVAYVFWWLSTAFMVTCAMVVYISLIKMKHAQEFTLTAAIFIPAVGTTTDALVGALVCTYASDLSAALAVPIIIVGWMLLGFGLFVALCVYVIFLHSLWTKGMWLPHAKLPGLFLFVGPLGQSSGAIQMLASAAMKNFPNYHRGQFLEQTSTTPISAVSEVLGLMFLGFDLFWFMFALFFVLEAAFKRKLSWSMTWWSTIFPVATLNVALLNLSLQLDSSAFRVLTTGLLLILLIDYFTCWIFTLRGIWKGTVLDGREQLAQLARKTD
ncbi:MAG: hypothetical protein Q9162_005812 [Coniocarpon cinnabarinum]